jgi:hypothetical protein
VEAPNSKVRPRYPVCDNCFPSPLGRRNIRKHVHKDQAKRREEVILTTVREQAAIDASGGQSRPIGITLEEKPCFCEQHQGKVLSSDQFYRNKDAKNGLSLYCADYYIGRGYVRGILSNPSSPSNNQRKEWLRSHGYEKMLREVSEAGDLDRAAQAGAAMETLEDDAATLTQAAVESTEPALFDTPAPPKSRRKSREPRPTAILDLSDADLSPLGSVEVFEPLERIPIPRSMSVQIGEMSKVLGNMAESLRAVETQETTASTTIVLLEEQLAQVTAQLRAAEQKLDRQKAEVDETLAYIERTHQDDLNKVRAYYGRLRSVGLIIPPEYDL